MRSSTNGAVALNSTGGAKVCPGSPIMYSVASSLSARLTARITDMPLTTVVRSLAAASGPSPSRLRSTATAPSWESMQSAEMSDSWQNAASSRADVSRVMITATFALLPSRPASSSSNPDETDEASASPCPSASAAEPEPESSADLPSSPPGLSPDSWNSFSNPARAASSSSSLNEAPSGSDWSLNRSSNGSSLITARPSCSGSGRRCAGRARPRSAARGPAP